MSTFKPKKQKIIKGASKVTGKIILFSIVLMGLFYLVQTNSLAISGLKITDFKKQIEVLEKDNKQLEIEFLQLQAISKIEQSSEELKMVKANNAKYLKEAEEIAAR